MIRYGSVCSGIEAATVAWHPLGWEPAWFSEIEPFPCAVLAHHYPNTPNMGDMLAITEDTLATHGPIDLLVGGTPCQSFSVAGLRGGLADPRGNLALRFCQLAGIARPRWVVWENVPGVLSSGTGDDFGSIVRGLEELGYGVAWRSLDAQYFGVAQRRERVFAVGHLGDWRRAAAVLLEPEGVCGNPPPSRAAGSRITTCPDAGSEISGDGSRVSRLVTAFDAQANWLVPEVSPALKRRDYKGPSSDGDGDGDGAPLIPVLSHSLTKRWDSSEDGCGRGTPLVPVHIICMAPDPIHARDLAMPITNRHGDPGTVSVGMAVRRLTPTECERLQGFPDGYTQVPYRGKPASDGPRYAALGNSMAVPVMHWIGRRIDKLERVGGSVKGATT